MRYCTKRRRTRQQPPGRSYQQLTRAFARARLNIDHEPFLLLLANLPGVDEVRGKRQPLPIVRFDSKGSKNSFGVNLAWRAMTQHKLRACSCCSRRLSFNHGAAARPTHHHLSTQSCTKTTRTNLQIPTAAAAAANPALLFTRLLTHQSLQFTVVISIFGGWV